MALIVNSRYVLRFIINSYELIYTATILDDTLYHVTFEDKFGKQFCYNKSTMMSAELIKEGDGEDVE